MQRGNLACIYHLAKKTEIPLEKIIKSTLIWLSDDFADMKKCNLTSG